MLIWGYGPSSIDLGPIGSRYCPTCGQERMFHTQVKYQYNHLYYIFRFVSGKGYIEHCEICGNGAVVDAAEVETRLGKNPIPAFDRYGMLIGLGGILGLILFAVILRTTGPEIRNIPDLTARMKRGDVTALAQLRREAEKGDRPSQEALGDLLLTTGAANLRNPEEAFRWMLAAANGGSIAAALPVADRYEHGTGVPANPTEALRWYRVSAAHGSAQAANSIGALYSRGTGVEADAKEAVRWFQKAAQGGDQPGQFNLAMAYLSGAGVDGGASEQNAAEAIKWLQKAAAPRDKSTLSTTIAADAMNHLGQLYEQGSGVKKDALKALNYYQSASEHNAEAKQSVERLKARLQASTAK